MRIVFADGFDEADLRQRAGVQHPVEISILVRQMVGRANAVTERLAVRVNTIHAGHRRVGGTVDRINGALRECVFCKERERLVMELEQEIGHAILSIRSNRRRTRPRKRRHHSSGRRWCHGIAAEGGLLTAVLVIGA